MNEITRKMILGVIDADGSMSELERRTLVGACSGKAELDAQRCDEPLLTPAELRTRLGVSTTTLWRMKGLPFLMVGSRRRYVWSEVEAFLAKGRA
jgi:hypothetical protein